jgi:molecular chaperone GrpE
VTEPTATGGSPDGMPEDVTTTPETDDAINTESVNDGSEVAPEQSGATPAGVAYAPGSGTASGLDDLTDVTDAGVPHPDTALAAERLGDLQRLQAEYVNYKRRVDRDREVHRDVAVGSVIEAMLPVLDDIHLARQHGDLEGGPFAAIADKLEGVLSKFGVVRFGEPGEAFDPMHHEALMHVEAELADGTEATTVVQVLQPGYRIGERVIRAARVAVADPQ